MTCLLYRTQWAYTKGILENYFGVIRTLLATIYMKTESVIAIQKFEEKKRNSSNRSNYLDLFDETGCFCNRNDCWKSKMTVCNFKFTCVFSSSFTDNLPNTISSLRFFNFNYCYFSSYVQANFGKPFTLSHFLQNRWQLFFSFSWYQKFVAT